MLATQNPIEQEGTYPLPEAQLDRFMFNTFVDYPDEEEEFDIVRRTTADITATVTPTLSGERILALQKIVRRVPVADHVVRYAMKLARLTRPHKGEAPDFIRDYVSWGAGPRASQYLVLGAKARAVLHGRFYAGVDDIRAVAFPVLRHRIVTNFNAEAEGIKPDDIIRRLIDTVAADEDAADGKSSAGVSQKNKQESEPRVQEMCNCSTVTLRRAELWHLRLVTPCNHATDTQKLLDPQMLARLQGLPLRARLIVEGYVSGVHRSPFHGFSIEFAEHREYAPGDDLRYLDWKVFGRTDKYYLKQFEEETNLVCYLLLDTSESMRYQSDAAPMSKLEYAQRAAAALAYLILHQQDSVGLVTFDSEIRSLVRPSSNPSHLKQILHVMENLGRSAKDRHRPDLPRPGRAVQETRHRDRPERPVRRRRRDDGRPEALPPPPARSDPDARARSGRGGFPLRASHAVPRPGAIARRAGRAAGAPQGVSGRVRPLSPPNENRLPPASDRLRAAADRSVVGGGAVELFGVAGMKKG